MEVLTRILSVLALLGAFLGIYAWWRHRRSKVGRSWRALARRLGGTVKADREGFWFDPQYELHCEIEGVPLCLDYYRGTGRHAATYTRVRSTLPAEVDAWVQRQGVVQSVVKLAGGQDAEIGEPEYDEVFVIKSEEPHRLRGRFSPDLRQLHLAHPEAQLHASAEGVVVVVDGLVIDPDRCLDYLQLAAVAAASLAGAGR